VAASSADPTIDTAESRWATWTARGIARDRALHHRIAILTALGLLTGVVLYYVFGL
jgi:hypothetical protein